MSCLFCRLVANELPSYSVYEDEYTRAFLDILPRAPGHTLVILKKHGWTLSEYTSEDLGHMMHAVQQVVAGLSKAFQTEVHTIGINHKEEAGVHHLHIHIIPRFPNDGGGVIQSIVKSEGKEGLGEVCEKIKKHIV